MITGNSSRPLQILVTCLDCITCLRLNSAGRAAAPALTITDNGESLIIPSKLHESQFLQYHPFLDDENVVQSYCQSSNFLLLSKYCFNGVIH
uniref:CSON005261 protein n=1 Tax=Culicoides sonorensis TaxID=179676 RepID=A0A336LW86_CULSO